jgi:hypothetical protein
MLEKLSKSLPPLVGSVVCAVLLDLLSFLLFGSSSRSKDENLFAQLFFARFELFFLSPRQHCNHLWMFKRRIDFQSHTM